MAPPSPHSLSGFRSKKQKTPKVKQTSQTQSPGAREAVVGAQEIGYRGLCPLPCGPPSTHPEGSLPEAGAPPL